MNNVDHLIGKGNLKSYSLEIIIAAQARVPYQKFFVS
jgi:hypothetical protein